MTLATHHLSITFKVVQTYSDGTEVDWNQQTFAGQAEPQHPAPQLTLVAAKDTAAKKTSSSGSDNTKYLAIADFVLAAAALAIGGLAFVRVRRWH